MSLGWSRRAPVDTLVGTETAMDFQIPLAELPRVSHELTGKDGEANGNVRFSRHMGHAVADLEVNAAPEVVCQRCMQPMRWPVDVKSRIALVTDYDAADRVPEGTEVFLVAELFQLVHEQAMFHHHQVYIRIILTQLFESILFPRRHFVPEVSFNVIQKLNPVHLHCIDFIFRKE